MRTIVGLRFVERDVGQCDGLSRRIKILQQGTLFVLNPAVGYSRDLIAEAEKGVLWTDVPLMDDE